MLNSEELLDWVSEMQNKTGYALEYPDIYHYMTSNRSQCARFGESVVSIKPSRILAEILNSMWLQFLTILLVV